MNLYCRECYRTVSPRIDRDAIPATEFTINDRREYVCHECLADPAKDCCFERREFGTCRCIDKAPTDDGSQRHVCAECGHLHYVGMGIYVSCPVCDCEGQVFCENCGKPPYVHRETDFSTMCPTGQTAWKEANHV